ncbi:cyclin-K-like [Gadus chalcogrammus]|uniref:cyclin-K-like n=1 Tax=Gadus chalcogrammus TaxID=1042646 RepID=UPI0024C3F6F4|nr:cyclin-K-like [Gadus chalcogrammus]
MKNIRENPIPVNQSAGLDHIKPCWYWDKRDLAHTPSQSEGLDPATEARYRREGARFIFDVGTRLGLHYDTLATGIIYFHRFYMFHSFKQFPRYVTGGCCLFLAGKVEETPKKCKDIIKTARSLLNDIQFAQFGDDPKEEVMVLERILLQTIKFDLQVEHPYQFLLRYAKQLKGDKNKVQKLVQMAWTFVNDSLCTMLSLQWEPEIIAVAVMYLAGRLCKFDIQEWTAKQSSRRWWEQFVQDVPMEVLEDICHQILDLYSQGKQQMPPGAGPAAASGPASAVLEKAASSSPAPPQQLQLQALPPPPALLPPSPAPQPAKKPSPQTSPPRQLKRAQVCPSPKEESKAAELSGAKVPRLEPPVPPMPAAQPPPEHKPPPSYPPPREPEPPPSQPPDAAKHPPPSHSASAHQPPPPSHPGSAHQPPPLPHRPAPPPSQASQAAYIMGIPTSSSYMSGEGFQSLQSLMTPDGSGGGGGGGGGGYPAPSQAYPPPPLGYHSHAYPPSSAGPPPPPSQAGASYHGPPPNAAYPPPQMPPPPYSHGYGMPPPPHGHMGMAHGIPAYGQGGAPPPGMPPGMPPPPPGGMSRGAWMR